MLERTVPRNLSESLLCDWRGGTYIASSTDWPGGCRLSAGERSDEQRNGFTSAPVRSWRSEPESGRHVEVVIGTEWWGLCRDVAEIVFYPVLRFREAFVGRPRWAYGRAEPTLRVELVPDPFDTTFEQFQRARAAGGPSCKWPRSSSRPRDPAAWRRTLDELRARGWYISEDPREPFYSGELPLREIERTPVALRFE